MGDLGIIGKESHNLKKMLQELGLSKNEKDYVVKKLINVCIRCTYFLFCKRTVTGQKPNFFLGISCGGNVRANIIPFLTCILAFLHSIQLARYEIA